uniref:Ig-like domain-containing protein n=1 Tax=Oncorhynchus tshawytscha TaxID=74940 RepID=A0AAZ3NX89_ONCTS
MTGKLSLLLLSFCLTCLNGQTMESIPSSPLQKKQGETLNLSCRGTGYTFTSYGMNWIRQPTGKPLEWMGWINTNTGAAGYTKSLEGRIELTKDSSVSMTHLKLSGLKSEDSAVYYCARWTQ